MSSVTSFATMASVPQPCGGAFTNVDGSCVRGGVLQGATSGFGVSSSSGQGTCAAFGLAYATMQPYSIGGIVASSNVSQLVAAARRTPGI